MSVFLEGNRVALRGLKLEDANTAYERWMNDRDVVRYLESRHFPHSVDSLREFIAAKSKSGDRDNLFLAITLKENGRHIGNIKLGPIDWIHRLGDIGIMIGERDCWGQGYATEAIGLVCGHAFETLNLHKLTASMYQPNESSRKIFAKAGFVMEGVRVSHYYCEGAYVNAILMGRIHPRDQNQGQGQNQGQEASSSCGNS